VECRLPIDAEEYVGSFGTAMVEVAYMWTKVWHPRASLPRQLNSHTMSCVQGAKFAEVCQLAQIYEGLLYSVVSLSLSLSLLSIVLI